jgi:hypothetical protein
MIINRSRIAAVFRADAERRLGKQGAERLTRGQTPASAATLGGFVCLVGLVSLVGAVIR